MHLKEALRFAGLWQDLPGAAVLGVAHGHEHLRLGRGFLGSLLVHGFLDRLPSWCKGGGRQVRQKTEPERKGPGPMPLSGVAL